MAEESTAEAIFGLCMAGFFVLIMLWAAWSIMRVVLHNLGVLGRGLRGMQDHYDDARRHYDAEDDWMRRHP